MGPGPLNKHRKIFVRTPPGILFLGVLFVVILTALLAASFIKTIPASAAAGINEQINFQGRLLNQQGATVPDGYYNIQFKIYRDGDGQTAGNATGSPAGALLWTENYLNNNSQGVQVKNGFLSVQLGSINAFGSSIDWNQSTLWLSMNIAGTNTTCTPFSSCSPDGEMTPMKRLSSTPYAMNAGKLGGLTSADFIQNTTTLQTANIAVQSGNAGNVGALIQGAASQTANILQIKANGVSNALVAVGATGAVTLQNSSNSTGALTVKNSTGDSLVNVDTSNKIVRAGSGSTQPVPNFFTPTTPDTGGSIANGTTYYYGITALHSGGETEISPIITVAISSATNTNRVVLTWNASYNATGYKIYRNTTNSFSSGSLLLTTIGSGATTTYTDTGSATSSGLPPSTAYTPTTIQVDSAANNPFSNGQVSKLGSIYYNTTSGEFQCYKDAGVGGTWADCGVTTLQGAYDNISGATNPSVKVDSTRGGVSIQDADTTINGNLLTVRASSGSGLGSLMFGIDSTGATTLQNASNQTKAFRVLNQSGQYLVNANTSSGYFITNTTHGLSNQVQNSGFETGGTATSGEQGWSGPAQASIVNDNSLAHKGNYSLHVTPNGTTLKTYAGTYYSVVPGDVVYFEGWVNNTSGANGTGGVIIEGYDKDQSLIGSSSDAASLPGTTYVLRAATYTVPSNVAYVRVAAVVNSGASTGTYHFDDLLLNNSQGGRQVFQNTANSTSAFIIQSASAAQVLFTADTSNNLLKVGDSTGTDTATTLLVVDSATADPTTSLSSKNGGLFYRSDTNSLKAVVGGAVVDVCTTAVTCSGYSASAGSTVQLQATSPGTAQTGNFNITGTGILTQLQTQDQSAASTNSSALTIRTGNATGSSSNSGNLILDVGTATSTPGTITIGHSGVATTMAGTLDVQGSSALSLGTSSSANGSILFRNAAGSNTVTIRASGSNPTSSWSLVLPQNPGTAGDCLKDSSGTGTLSFGNCAAGITVNLQDTYNNSSNPATMTLADGKDLKFVAQDTSTDPNVIVNLQCTTSCGSNGRFVIQNSGSDIFTVKPNSGGIVLNAYTQIGSSTTDSTQTNFQFDSYNGTSDSGTCTTTTNQGAIYYNTSMGSIRACVNGSWGDVSNPDTLGLLTFGIVPSTGANPYDLPSLVVAGASGPCKVSWASTTTVAIEACVAYSGGRRVNVSATTLSTNSATTDNANLTTSNRWGHICLTGSNSQPAFTSTSGQATALTAMPTFSASAPILCLADVQGSSTSAGQIDNLYDTRTFTTTLKEAVNTSTASELGMLVDSSSGGGLVPAATCSTGTCSGKLYGIVVATDGSTSSSTPNSIVASVGPAYVKAISGTAGEFIKSSTTSGYGATVTSIPNNAFYYSAGNTRTSFSTTCSAANNCNGSLYVNFIVR